MRTIRRTLSVLLCALMALSMIPAAALTASAAEIPGDWTVYRAPKEMPDEQGNDPEEFRPAPGYEYTAEGFRTIPADTTDTTPFFTVQTKEKQSVKDGVYFEYRADQFPYRGPTGEDDNWMSFSIWDTKNVNPGDSTHGSGWLCLIRSGGTGEDAGIFGNLTDGKFIPTISENHLDADHMMYEDGKESYSLTVTYEDDLYHIAVNGVDLGQSERTTELLDRLSPEGEFYIGVTFYSTTKDGVADMTITRFGADRDSATTPVGSDRREPDPNVNRIGAPADPNAVPANQPALLFDAAKSSYSGDCPTYNVKSIEAQGDNSFRIVASDRELFIDWKIRKSITYLAEDFPVLAMLIRNFYGSYGTCFYCAGDVFEPGPAYTAWQISDGEFYSCGADDYTLVFVDLESLWEGRINCVRQTFVVDSAADEETNHFDLLWMGCFRSVDEATAYATADLRARDVLAEEPTAQPTEAPTEAPTAPPATSPCQRVPTEAPTGEATGSPADGKSEGKGCASLGLGLVALLTAAGAAYVLKKRR